MKNQTTDAAKIQIGEFIDGGYVAGFFQLNGEHYALIVAPKAQGESDPMPWGEFGKAIAATSCNDGHANTQAMADNNSELAQWARQLTINGVSDWYIPARDELELIYRNLKPTDDDNIASFRDGDNPSSLPPGYPYTDEAPAQTALENFQRGNSEALEPAWYWSSTQYSANYAWVQYFDGGYQDFDLKVSHGRVRAVRRFKLIH